MYNYPVIECLVAFAIVFSIGYLFADSNGREETVAPSNGVARTWARRVHVAIPRLWFLDVARKPTATAIGGVAGAIQVASSAMTEAKGGDLLCVIASAILGGLLGGAAGCAPGAAFGAPIDHVLPDCSSCQAFVYVFDVSRTDPALS